MQRNRRIEDLMKPSSAKAKSYLRPLNKYRQAKTAKEYLDQRYEIVDGEFEENNL